MNGSELITQERTRQVEKEGYDFEHDEQHREGVLINAATAYLMCPGNWIYRDPYEVKGFERINPSMMPNLFIRSYWPWDIEDFKPKSRISNLVRAGALIAAEIDQLQALEDGK